ncbi:odorant receptor 22c-like [Vespula squamosa]|uniref:Odorant receptor n=1 Tax=Vespula squamosa TaxID=30214 RepID=A0ABD2C7F7_VESSQ
MPLNETRSYTLIIPMNWYTGQERHFFKLLILQLGISMILGLCVISGISMYILILQHICAMFDIIGCLLDNLLDVKEGNLKVIDDKVICIKLIHVIKIHNRTIQYTNVLNKTYDVISLVLLTCALCFIGIAVISILEIYIDFKNSSSDIGSLSLPILYVIFHLIWIFVLCHIGQYLQNISETTFYKAYDTPWYIFPKQSKKLLFFLIARSYNPACVSFGKMFVASHEFFTGNRGDVNCFMVIPRRMVEFEISQFAITRKLLSMNGTWPYQNPSQRFTRVLLISITLIISCSAQILCCLMQIMNDWSNIRQTEHFGVLLHYAFLYRKCILITRQWYRFLKTSIYFTVPVSYNSYVSLMFLSSLKPLLLDLMVPLNETRQYTLIIPMNWLPGQDRHFFKILIFQLGVGIIMGLCAIGAYSMHVLILQHICAMFHIIG